ncbi:hypothetical protein O3P69_004684 [Scylla paramamosain]|uniref:Peptidase A2 domain-containing protein n=1 Tax=Scylla paramamosain TaxID=85552 RepID=A0AAW0UC15_SCYPA
MPFRLRPLPACHRSFTSAQLTCPRSHRILGSALVTSLGPHVLLWVKDTCSGARFLVDLGAEVSVVPAMEEDHRSQPRTTYNLLAENHIPIATYCTWTLHLGLLPSSRFPWAFVVVDVDEPILGMDFLEAHNLLVDPHDGR